MQIVLDVSEYQSVGQLNELLTNADDEIVGVFIKAAQGITYIDSLATAFAKCCASHNTAFAYYDFLTNDQANAQALTFAQFVKTLPPATILPMVDCEGFYAKYELGVEHWETAYGKNAITYAQLSNMPNYADLTTPKWVAQYDEAGEYYRPSEVEIDSYRAQGYALWQWTDAYMGYVQDASVLLVDFSVLRA
jgi:GH25 family lysozyme M1 (1,4-beta-N-acetylmuramidase)